MKFRKYAQQGYSMIEMLVVVAIIAILAVAGISSISSRPTLAVRATLDELEGVVMGAQKLATARGADVFLVADGVWDPKAANFFVMGYDVAKPVDAGPAATVQRIIDNSRNPAAAAVGSLPEGSFRLSFNATSQAVAREHINVGIVVAGSNWYTTALGTAPDLTAVAPGNVDPIKTALLPANNLCQGGVSGVAIVSGQNKRWIRDFHISVAGLRGGMAVPGSAVGIIVVPANSATTYKFLNLGNKDNDGTWRRM